MKNKRIALGLSVIALAASISSANVSANSGLPAPTIDWNIDYNTPLSEIPDELYTVVGPNYFTFSNLDIEELYADNITVSVADTSIADFVMSPYGSGGMVAGAGEAATIASCTYKLACLQGKKNGKTEIIIEEDGEEIRRIGLTSATLTTPDTLNYLPSGATYDGTGSLNGASNDLLKLDTVYTPSGKAHINITGDRSFRITSNEVIDQGKVAYAIWKIGDQYIGGGTTYNIVMIEANDRASLDNQNKDYLMNTAISVFTKITTDGWTYSQSLMNGNDLPEFKTTNGSILHIYHPGDNFFAFMPGYRGSKHVINLDANEKNDLEEAEKTTLSAKLPEGAKSVGYGELLSELYSVISNSDTPGERGSGDITTRIGRVNQFGEAVQVSIEVPEVEAVKKNFERKWYVAITSYDGTSEIIEATYDESNHRLNFTAKKMGNFAYGYVDKVITPLVPDTGILSTKSMMTAVATFVPLTLVAFGAVAIKAKKHGDHKKAKRHNHFN